MNCSLYIHIPFCTKKCDYCDFFSRQQLGKIPDEYIEALIKEEEYYAKKYDIQEWNTIYFGGGTPGLLNTHQLSSLLNRISKRITSKTQEITLEMNPESIIEEKIEVASRYGVTRLSLGIQSFNDKALNAVNRHCSSKKAKDSLELIKSKWKGQLNLDCIAGLPEQTEKEFLSSLEKIISYNPDHISLYTLTVEEGTALYKNIESGIVQWNSDIADEQWIKGREILQSNGYVQYEVSNFSKPSKISLHNMNYWRQQDYIGIGSGASGTIYGNKTLRWTNTKNIEQWMNFWNSNDFIKDKEFPCEIEEIDESTKEFEYLMMGFRTIKGINSLEYEKKFSMDERWKGNLALRLGKSNGIWNKFSKENLTLEKKQKDGSINYSLNEKGILLLNKFLVELL